mgnify:CR=1 FL=1
MGFYKELDYERKTTLLSNTVTIFSCLIDVYTLIIK